MKLVIRAKLSKKVDVCDLILGPKHRHHYMVVYKIIFSSVILIVGSFSSLAQDKEGFVLVRQAGTTSIYERWIIFPKSNPPIKAREVKGEFFYKNSVASGFNLLRDEKKIRQWQSHVEKFKVYLQLDTTTWLEYSYHDIPWPVSDQDHFLKYSIIENSPRKIFITFESQKNELLAPVYRGVTRMELSGSWTWEQVTPFKTKATYRILSKPIGIPKFLTDPIIRNNIMTTIEEYIGLLEPIKAK